MSGAAKRAYLILRAGSEAKSVTEFDGDGE
jgi:hypothetical protein